MPARRLVVKIQLMLMLAVLGGCANLPAEPPGVTLHSSEDLSEVRDLALRLARELGRDQILVALDMDNTLLAMNTEIGSDQWYDWQKELQSSDRCDPRLVPDRLAAQGAFYHLGSMRPTQADGPALVREIQDSGITTLLLTARGHDFRLATFRELRRNGISFRDSAPGPTGGYSEPYTPPGASRPVRYEDGAYLLAGQHKGDMLLALFDQLGVNRPKAVIFVDDKTRNTDAVIEALDRAGIRGEVFHYTREARRVAGFDGDRTVTDWTELLPAILTVQAVMGSDNYRVPDAARVEDCP